MKAIIISISTGESFELDVPAEYYEYNGGNNVNGKYIDEFCDLVEDNLPDNDDWDTGYRYKIEEE